MVLLKASSAYYPLSSHFPLSPLDLKKKINKKKKKKKKINEVLIQQIMVGKEVSQAAQTYKSTLRNHFYVCPS